MNAPALRARPRHTACAGTRDRRHPLADGDPRTATPPRAPTPPPLPQPAHTSRPKTRAARRTRLAPSGSLGSPGPAVPVEPFGAAAPCHAPSAVIPS